MADRDREFESFQGTYFRLRPSPFGTAEDTCRVVGDQGVMSSAIFDLDRQDARNMIRMLAAWLGEEPPARAAVLEWDYREQPCMDDLARMVAEMSDGQVHLRSLDTGSQEYAVAVSTARLDDLAAAAVFAWYQAEGRTEEVLTLGPEVPRG